MQDPGRTHGDPSEPNLSSQSALFKIRWAQKQIDDLELGIERLVADYNVTGGAGYDAEARIAYIKNIKIHPACACLTGDIIFSLRSALDCCWMGLKRSIEAKAKRIGGIPRGDRNNVASTISRSFMEEAYPELKDFLLEELGAYEGGDETLSLIGKVDNWNKHNMLVVLAQRTASSKATYRLDDGRTFVLEGEVLFSGFTSGNDALVIADNASGPFKLCPTSNVSVDIILSSQEPSVDVSLMPFLSSALVKSQRGVAAFCEKFSK